ncbi:MAG: MBL fold metallo-hydrolase [Clostridia bacterium]|nr:MBL fold metallo-hydrolase [Oscillospiraceae bacterium]MBQ7032700.1 MBL fold metallo-hydrolase [Clostridia bacterium]
MRKKRSVLIILLVAIVAFSGRLFRESRENKTGPVALDAAFAVHFIDVGQADAALVVCDGKSMLIDGGNAEDSNLIAAYLEKQEISHLDYIICSHAHEDHVGGLSGALSVCTAGAVFAPESEADTRAYRNFKEKTADQGLEIQNPAPGDRLKLGRAGVLFLGPVTEDKDDLNNTSVILKVTYGETSFLFTGDAEREEEQDVLDTGMDLSATVLKVGHHGSSTSTSYPFLREVMPEYAVISVGKGNDYGHPHKETLARLRDADAAVYRTDEMGDIVMTSDGKTVDLFR